MGRNTSVLTHSFSTRRCRLQGAAGAGILGEDGIGLGKMRLEGKRRRDAVQVRGVGCKAAKRPCTEPTAWHAARWFPFRFTGMMPFDMTHLVRHTGHPVLLSHPILEH